MRRKVLSFVIGLILTLPALAQIPRITTNVMELNFELLTDSTGTMMLIVENIGNRDLEFMAGNWLEYVEFEKENWADWTLPENQDHISESVIITRADNQGIFNFAIESGFDNNTEDSPTGTIWSWGPTGTSPLEDYRSWIDEISWDPPSMVGEVLSMYSIEDEMYFDVYWESWTEGSGGGESGGGGFAYTRTQPVPWLSLDKDMGIVEPLDQDTIMVTADASGLHEGTFEGAVLILTNDTLNPMYMVSVTLNVDGTGEIATPVDSLKFDSVYLGGSVSLQIPFMNEGSETVVLNDISATLPEFSSAADFEIAPESMAYLDVTFTPGAVQSYLDSLTVVCDQLDTTITIILTGAGKIPPKMEVSPLEFSYELETNDIITDSILVKNTGEGTLMFWFPGYGAQFTKADYADWTLPENQDSITPNVILTRADNQSIFNIAQETEYAGWDNGSPLGTLWAVGSSLDPQSDYMEYSQLGQWITSISPWSGGYSWYQPIYTTSWYHDNYGTVSLYIPDAELYQDIQFIDWTQSNNGGGFSWLRYPPGVNPIEDWLTLSVQGDTLESGDSAYVVFTGNATGAIGGVYSYTLNLWSNDPLNSMVDINMNFTITGTPDILLSDANLNFGSIYLGAFGELELEIMNDGDDVLDITDIYTDSTAFEVDMTTMSIDPGESDFIMITYMPEGLYATEDTLYIMSNDPDMPLAKVVLDGTGIVPPEMSVAETSLSGEAMAGSSDTVMVIVTNSSSATALNWILTSQHDTVFFEKEDYADWTLPENQDMVTEDVILTRADNQGLFNIAMESSFNGNSPAGTQWASSPTGVAIPMDYDTWRNANGSWPPGMVGDTYSMLISEENTYYDVMVMSWTESSMGGGFSHWRAMASPFLQFDMSSGSIPAGETDTLEIILQAEYLYAGEYEAILTVASDAPGNPVDQLPVMFTVTGEPEVSVGGASIAFGDEYLGGSSVDSILISNIGTDVLAAQAEPGATGMFAFEPASMELMPDEMAYLHVTFMPAAAEVYEDTLTLSSNDPDSPEIKIPLSGTGLVPPALTYWPEMINYPAYPVDSVKVDSLYFTNTGDGDLYLELMTSAGWLMLSDDQDTLAAGDTVAVGLTIDPGSNRGEQEGMVWIGSNDPMAEESMIEVHLYVNGIFEINPLADVMVNEGFESSVHVVDTVFMSVSGDSIGITPISSETGVVTVAVVNDSALIVSEVGFGSSQITLMAKDAYGNREFSDFMYMVNAVPTVATPLQDLSFNEGFGSESVSVEGVFVDRDLDALSYTAESDNTGVVTVSMDAMTLMLMLMEQGIGTSNISVMADDGKGGTAEDSFTVTVVEVELSAPGELSKAILLYPNPADGELFIRFEELVNRDLQIEIVGLTGKTVYQEKFERVEDRINMDLTHLPAGSYIIRLSDRGKELLTTEVVIQ